ncbi:MAG: 3-deoxy-8-phosphooctulonate synthase [Planctomycetes bacterium]|nr:3-deoxy-8-phosphooctulonate synthase [Planctomycetota bacterium]
MPTQRLLILANPISGGGKSRALAPALQRELAQRGVAAEVYFTKCAGDATARAHVAASEPWSGLVAVGGDGTVNEVLAGMDDPTRPLGVLPVGTANVLAMELRLPKKPAAAAAVIAAGHTRSLAIGIANDRRFLLFIGAGVDGSVVQRLAQVRSGTLGKHKWAGPILHTVRHWPRWRLRATFADGQVLDDLSSVLVTACATTVASAQLTQTSIRTTACCMLCFRMRSRTAWAWQGLRVAASAAAGSPSDRPDNHVGADRRRPGTLADRWRPRRPRAARDLAARTASPRVRPRRGRIGPMTTTSGTKIANIGTVRLGGNLPFALIAGPCVIENRDHTLRHAERIARICGERRVPVVFKSSFDKANRTSGGAFRGIGLEEGLRILGDVKAQLGVPVLTDVHEVDQCAPCAEVVDCLQIPAFLCRQTDLLLAAGQTGRAVNVKKGQFMAPEDVGNVLAKVTSTGNPNVAITERGVSFGYRTLVVDFTGFPTMRGFGQPLIFDATHSVQRPGGQGTSTGGDRTKVPFLCRAAIACGIDGLFLEVHDDPDHAPSDGPNMLRLQDLPGLLDQLLRIQDACPRT